MISIETCDQKFKLKYSAPGTGWKSYSVEVKRLREVHALVDHYFSQHMHKKKRGCPQCKDEKPTRPIGRKKRSPRGKTD